MSYVAQMQSMGVVRPDRTQQRYGISAESFNDIRNRLDHAGQQQRPVQAPQQEPGQLTLDQAELIQKMKQALEFQAVQFDRFRELTERKFTSLSKELLDLTMQLKEARDIAIKLRDKEDVIAARAALHQYQQGDKPPVNQAIDRTGVAPSQVQVHDIFNCSGKRF